MFIFQAIISFQIIRDCESELLIAIRFLGLILNLLKSIESLNGLTHFLWAGQNRLSICQIQCEILSDNHLLLSLRNYSNLLFRNCHWRISLLVLRGWMFVRITIWVITPQFRVLSLCSYFFISFNMAILILTIIFECLILIDVLFAGKAESLDLIDLTILGRLLGREICSYEWLLLLFIHLAPNFL